jgi:uncharacterized membrane protein
MRLMSILISALFIISCNNSATKKEDLKDTAKQVNQIPQKPARTDTIFTGLGTEPFWSVYVVNNSKIIFHPAEGSDVEVPFVPATAPDTITTRYSSVTGNTSMELTIIKKECSDGMSEHTYPYEVTLLVNKKKYTGCGKK